MLSIPSATTAAATIRSEGKVPLLRQEKPALSFTAYHAVISATDIAILPGAEDALVIHISGTHGTGLLFRI